MGEVLGISFSAIEFVMEIYEITDPYERRILFEKIQLLDSLRLRAIKASSKRGKT